MSELQRLLITGATGFIGSRLALHAHRAGFDVLATGRTSLQVEIDRANELRAAGIRLAAGTLQDAELLERLVMDRECVIHLAAAQHESQMPEHYFRMVNVEGTRALLEASKAAGVARFVYGSSIGVYGSCEDDLLTESSLTRPENAYTRTKLEAEMVVNTFGRELQTCILRIPETYGPSDFRLLKLFRAIQNGHFVMLGDGLNRRQCMHVNDLVRALLIAAREQRAVGETFVIAGAEPMTTHDMVAVLADVLGRPVPRLRLPLWPFMLAARVCEATLPRVGVQPPLHRRRLDFFAKSFVFSTAKAQQVLGFQPEIDFRSGAADTARWYRSRGFLSAPIGSELPRIESA